MQVSTSTAWLRGLAAVFGLGSVFVIYRLGHRVAGKPEGLIAALLLTLSPLFINHAQEVRYYTLSTFLSLGGTLALTHALERPTRASICWWAVARILAIYTTPLCLILLLPDVVLFGWSFRNQRQQLLIFAKGLLCIGIVWLPSVWAVARFTKRFLSEGSWVYNYPKPGPILIVGELTHLTAYWPLKHLLEPGLHWQEFAAVLAQQSTVKYLADHFFESNLFGLFFYVFFTVVLVGLLCLAALRVKHSARLLWVVAWVFLPAMVVLLVSYASASIWKSRYILFFSPYCLILLAAGFMQLWNRRPKAAVMVGLLYLVAVGAGLVHYFTTLYRVFNGLPT
jgi:uncharacterized membrane protein